MIRLARRPLNPDLRATIMGRTERLLALLQARSPVPEALASSYRDPRLKDILRAETADKCAYCESKISHAYWGDVEHIIAKTVRPELTFDHSNLTFACAVCNGHKGDYHDDACPLINPFEDQPDDEILALGPMVMRRPNRPRGQVTVSLLRLNRAALVERRTERLEELARLVDAITTARSEGHRRVLEKELCREIGDDGEYAFVARAYVREVLNLDCAEAPA